MKKFMSVLAVVVLLASVVGCSKKPGGEMAGMACCAKAKAAGYTCPGCTKPVKGIKLGMPELLTPPFGNSINVPDGLALGPDNNLYLAVPNYADSTNNPSLKGKIMKITFADDGTRKVELCAMLSPHPESGEVHPMGIEFGPDGNLYIADNQYFINSTNQSRVLRLNFEDGKPTTCDVVVTGTKLSNAIRWSGDNLFVSDTFFDIPDKKHQSGIHRFTLAELNEGTVALELQGKDGVVNGTNSHLVAQFTGKDFGGDGETAGADGLAFDSKGNLFCSLFGDGQIFKVTFDEDGKGSQELVVDDPQIECGDGIYYDKKRDVIWVTNSKKNALHILDPKDNSIGQVWENDDNDGSTGLLDQPCEPIVRGDQLFIVSFDFADPGWGLKNQGPDEINTISVFDIITK
ncbi:MAG: hypothetical protein QGI24_10840 [Kiritimatiellia bacterium]|jgi:hypothetical protein|nr:hypothetical protein [Kiritimatiellia bacterium]MDP6849271.1 hypothetical protein [Kiritimatiellia bacterium]